MAPVEEQLNRIHQELVQLDLALTMLARHEREATGDTKVTDAATKNITRIADTLYTDGY